jgi:ABC-type multidrug transport system ATPase subunit
VLLTTHSMAEAERLCDRLGVLLVGKLRCLGSPAQLMARYGGYYTLTVAAAATGPAHAAVQALWPAAVPLRCAGGTWEFRLPRCGVRLADVFRAMAAARAAGDVAECGVASTTLEEVFLNLAQNQA